jgi:RNA polymerase sigma-70 factor, ECF subfamily
MVSSADQNNDRGAQFVQLLTQHERRLEGFVLALLPNWHDAEEVVQETKIKLWQQFPEYDPSKDFGAWACKIAYYLVLAMRRRNQGNHVLLGEEFLETVAAKVTEMAPMAIDREDAMQRCLRRLSDAKRALLQRCYTGRDTIVQIARQLGRTDESVRQELRRIRRTLHRCIDAALHRGGNR